MVHFAAVSGRAELMSRDAAVLMTTIISDDHVTASAAETKKPDTVLPEYFFENLNQPMDWKRSSNDFLLLRGNRARC
jgi:hypothetical protein